MSQWKRISVRVALGFATTFVVAVFLAPRPADAQSLFRNAAVGGIAIDGGGIVSQPTVEASQKLRERMLAEVDGPPDPLASATELRKISLRRLESSIADAVNHHTDVLPEEIQFLGGIQRIKYVFVFPEYQDIVLAGPGEGWRVDNDGSVVGVTTGRPVIQLDDLLIALRSVTRARETGISCSIDPRPEGLRAMQRLLRGQRQFQRGVIRQIEKVMGPQNVTVTGVPTDTHFARVLVASDYRMKRIAMNLDRSPVPELPSFLQLVQSRRGSPRTMTPRWWLACNYEPLARSRDGLAWELRGPGVKAMTEQDILTAAGTIEHSGRPDPVAQQWASLMTENYDSLSRADKVFGELRNLMDLCVVAALIEQQQLLPKVGLRLPLLMQSDSDLMTSAWNPARTVATECSFIKKGRNFIITASGGIQIGSWQVIQQTRNDPRVEKTRAKAVPSATSAWCWN